MKPSKLFLGLTIFFLISCKHEIKQETSLSFLHTSGQYILNENNDTVLLKGVGIGNWLLQEGYMWHFGREGDRPRKIEKIVGDLTSPEFSEHFWKEFRENYIKEADIIRMKELGFNSVRPAMNARVFLTEGDTAVFIEENFALLDSLVYWCGKNDIYVILDMHGAPGGQTGQNIDDSPNDEPELFMNPLYEQRLTRLWIKIVERYKNNPVVAGYDLLNEPLPERTGAADKYKQMLEPMYKRLTSEIRKIDQKHIIILEGANWSNDWSVFTEPFDANLVYQFHYYCWNNPDNLNDISHYLRERERLNAPVWVGETGERNPSIYYATTQYFEKNNIGWSYWTWKKIDNRQVAYSINAPEGYDQIIDYSRDGEKPSVEFAERVLTQLLDSMKVENCKFMEPITQALFRRVPARIYAVNYGHEGPFISYGVNDTSKAEYYRKNEPVKTLLLKSGNRRSRSSMQAIRLNGGEWTSYFVNSNEDFNASITLRVKAEKPGSELLVDINKKSQRFELPDTSWQDLLIDDFLIKEGPDSIYTIASKGTIELLHFDITKK